MSSESPAGNVSPNVADNFEQDMHGSANPEFESHESSDFILDYKRWIMTDMGLYVTLLVPIMLFAFAAIYLAMKGLSRKKKSLVSAFDLTNITLTEKARLAFAIESAEHIMSEHGSEGTAIQYEQFSKITAICYYLSRKFFDVEISKDMLENPKPDAKGGDDKESKPSETESGFFSKIVHQPGRFINYVKGKISSTPDQNNLDLILKKYKSKDDALKFINSHLVDAPGKYNSLSEENGQIKLEYRAIEKVTGDWDERKLIDIETYNKNYYPFDKLLCGDSTSEEDFRVGKIKYGDQFLHLNDEINSVYVTKSELRGYSHLFNKFLAGKMGLEVDNDKTMAAIPNPSSGTPLSDDKKKEMRKTTDDFHNEFKKSPREFALLYKASCVGKHKRFDDSYIPILFKVASSTTTALPGSTVSTATTVTTQVPTS